jgi:hypothetical protein
MEQMIIANAKYNAPLGVKSSINATIDGKVLSVPLDPANRHYAEICKQVEAGILVIQEADGGSE